MKAFSIGQLVWIIKFGGGQNRTNANIEPLGLDFWPETINEIVSTETSAGVLYKYVLKNGEIKLEEDLYPNKNEAIQHAIDLLDLEMDDE